MHNYYKPNLEIELGPEYVEMENKINRFRREYMIRFVLEKQKKG